MQWIRNLLEERDSPRGAHKPQPLSLPPREEESEDEFEPLGDVEADPEDGKQTLEFGRHEDAGGQALVGFCEVKGKGFVEACQWHTAQLRPNQKGPACKIRF